MKNALIALVQSAIESLKTSAIIEQSIAIQISVEHSRQDKFGDYACNIALALAKQTNKNPRELAQLIIDNLPENQLINKTEIAGPGFINFYLNNASQQQIIADILQQQQQFGLSNLGRQQKVNIEFVSANPTGPLHVGHGRSAAFGSALSNLLASTGFDITREYYVNDAGRQMDILATSIWLRYLQQQGFELRFPQNGYQGGYVIDIAKSLQQNYQNQFVIEPQTFWPYLSPDLEHGGDKEKHIDDLIQQAKQGLGNDYDLIHKTGLDYVLSDIKQDLHAFHIDYQCWFSEKSLVDQGAIERAIQRLDDAKLLYQKNGATWFKSSIFGDDKDRVVTRDNGQTTYFASDAAYLLNKLERGFDTLIYIFGADHHGYVPRLRALLSAFGQSQEKLKIPLVQFAILYRGNQQVQMSTRSGSFVTLRELREEVGSDATRFFYVMRKPEQHLDFDLELAKSKSNENPVYYIQYAHARICSVLRQAKANKQDFDQTNGLKHLSLLNSQHEKNLLTQLGKLTETVNNASERMEPHLLCHYLRDLANAFHSYYNNDQFLVEDTDTRHAKLCLIYATKQVIINVLSILGIDAPEAM